VSALPRSRSREFMLVALASLAALLALYVFATTRSGLEKDDTRHYVQMAQDFWYLPRVPYTFRILTPLLVSALPIETTRGFSLVTLGGLWVTAILLYLLLRGLGLGRLASGGGLAIFLGSGLTTRALTTPTYVDALTYLTEVAGFYCLLARREAWFALTLLLGTLNRETALFLAPVYLLELRADGRLTRQNLPRVGLVLGPPLLALACVVTLKLLAGGVLQSGLGVLETKPRTFEQNVPSTQDLADIYSVFGLAWLLALLNLRRAPRLLRHGLVFGLLVVLQLSVSRGDESRNLSHLLPLVLPLAALELQGLSPRAALLLVLGCLASTVNFRWALLTSAPLRYVVVAGGSLLGLAVTLFRHWKSPTLLTGR
jgi:hypothetical protein